MATLLKSDPIARSKPCLRCGYSLRNLLDSKNCPECNLPIWLSLSGSNALDMSNPLWLRRLARGAIVMSIAQVPAVAALVTAYKTRDESDPNLTLFIALYFLIFHTGLFLLLSNERRYPDNSPVLRNFGRGISVIAAFIGADFLSAALGIREMTMNGIAAIVLAGAITLWSALLTWIYLKRIAPRLTDHSRTVTRICGYLILATLMQIGRFLFVGDFFLMVAIRWVLQCLPWIYFPFVAAMLAWLGRAFLRASRTAKGHWQTETIAR